MPFRRVAVCSKWMSIAEVTPAPGPGTHRSKHLHTLSLRAFGPTSQLKPQKNWMLVCCASESPHRSIPPRTPGSEPFRIRQRSTAPSPTTSSELLEPALQLVSRLCGPLPSLALLIGTSVSKPAECSVQDWIV